MIYALFCILLLEVGLRFLFSRPGIQGKLQANDNYSWQRSWVFRHHAAAPEIYYAFDRFHPTLGWMSQPNLRDVRVFQDKFLNTNGQGLRGRKDFALGKHPQKVRILFLGDSFTFGDEVSDDETFAEKVQTMLPEAETINMGVHGYGHDQMLLIFLEMGLRYRPDIVILGFLPADMERNVLRFRDFAKPMFAVRNGVLVLTNSPVRSPETILRWDWVRPRIIDALSMTLARFRTVSGRRELEEQKVTRLILDELVDAVFHSGAKLLFAYLPSGAEISSSDALLPGEAFLFKYCETNSRVGCFSVRPTFQKRIRAGARFDAPFHWSADGHQVVAEAVVDYLTAEKGMIERVRH
jgi:hypothetical protein